MSAARIVRHLIEEPEDDPLDIGPLDRYTGPVAFNASIKDILEHAEFLKQQAEQAGALNLVRRPNSLGTTRSDRDIDRAFLLIAVRQILEQEEHAPQKIAQVLEREMHSIWS
jgi:hypothetical protein